jgi:hypothetical protein
MNLFDYLTSYHDKIADFIRQYGMLEAVRELRRNWYADGTAKSMKMPFESNPHHGSDRLVQRDEMSLITAKIILNGIEKHHGIEY